MIRRTVTAAVKLAKKKRGSFRRAEVRSAQKKVSRDDEASLFMDKRFETPKSAHVRKTIRNRRTGAKLMAAGTGGTAALRVHHNKQQKKRGDRIMAALGGRDEVGIQAYLKKHPDARRANHRTAGAYLKKG